MFVKLKDRYTHQILIDLVALFASLQRMKFREVSVKDFHASKVDGIFTQLASVKQVAKNQFTLDL